eukprot:GDKH01024606.1.p3 GENE.GDKH01024606.1~~GDKH01024606.1.p3  ORF type:complete len:76 (+),score=9.62 GDKH01024606.1:1-228(+)
MLRVALNVGLMKRCGVKDGFKGFAVNALRKSATHEGGIRDGANKVGRTFLGQNIQATHYRSLVLESEDQSLAQVS